MLRNIKTIITTLFIIAAALVFLPAAGVAADDGTAAVAGGQCHQGVTFFPRWYDGLCDDSTGGIKSPADVAGSDTGHKFATWMAIIAMNLVRMLLYVVGYASLIFIIYGGFKYMTQGDNANGTAAARKTIQNAIIGLVISILSVAIVTFVTGRISG